MKCLFVLLIFIVSCNKQSDKEPKIIREALLLKHLTKGIDVSELEKKIGTQLTLISRGEYIPAIETKTLLSSETKTYIFKVRVEIDKFIIESWQVSTLPLSVLKD